MARKFMTRDFMRSQNDDWIAQCSQEVLGKVNKRHNKRIPDLLRYFGETLDVEISPDGVQPNGSRGTTCHTLIGDLSNINKLNEVSAEGNTEAGPSATGRDETTQQIASRPSEQVQVGLFA